MLIFGGVGDSSRRDQTAYLRSLEVTNHNPWDVCVTWKIVIPKRALSNRAELPGVDLFPRKIL